MSVVNHSPIGSLKPGLPSTPIKTKIVIWNQRKLNELENTYQEVLTNSNSSKGVYKEVARILTLKWKLDFPLNPETVKGRIHKWNKKNFTVNHERQNEYWTPDDKDILFGIVRLKKGIPEGSEGSVSDRMIYAANKLKRSYPSCKIQLSRIDKEKMRTNYKEVGELSQSISTSSSSSSQSNFTVPASDSLQSNLSLSSSSSSTESNSSPSNSISLQSSSPSILVQRSSSLQQESEAPSVKKRSFWSPKKIIDLQEIYENVHTDPNLRNRVHIEVAKRLSQKWKLDFPLKPQTVKAKMHRVKKCEIIGSQGCIKRKWSPEESKTLLNIVREKKDIGEGSGKTVSDRMVYAANKLKRSFDSCELQLRKIEKKSKEGNNSEEPLRKKVRMNWKPSEKRILQNCLKKFKNKQEAFNQAALLLNRTDSSVGAAYKRFKTTMNLSQFPSPSSSSSSQSNSSISSSSSSSETNSSLYTPATWTLQEENLLLEIVEKASILDEGYTKAAEVLKKDKMKCKVRYLQIKNRSQRNGASTNCTEGSSPISDSAAADLLLSLGQVFPDRV